MTLTLPQDPVKQATERSHTTLTSQIVQPRFVALRTVPVFLKNGYRRIKVNASLDDASTKTNLNADVAAKLGLQGHPQSVTVNVLNGQVETFETMPVKVELESLDGNAKLSADGEINAKLQARQDQYKSQYNKSSKPPPATHPDDPVRVLTPHDHKSEPGIVKCSSQTLAHTRSPWQMAAPSGETAVIFVQQERTLKSKTISPVMNH